MSSDYLALSHIELQPGTEIRRPPVVPREYRLDTPAIEFMTDFARVQPVTAEPTSRTLLNYVPPPHVRVIKIYGVTQDR